MERGFVYSHVLAVYYNWKNKVLLKDKLDDMDKLIAEHGEAIAEKLVTNEKFAETLAGYVTKAMMSSVNVNDENKVPTSAFIHSLAQQITANQTAITALNADRKILNKFAVANVGSEGNNVIFKINSTRFSGLLLYTINNVSASETARVDIVMLGNNDDTVSSLRLYPENSQGTFSIKRYDTKTELTVGALNPWSTVVFLCSADISAT